MKGYIHSVQSMGTVDGPGVRTVVFGGGCLLRCSYCHNPDTWDVSSMEQYDVETLSEKIMRYYPYIKNGGVTFSGGEPLCQAEFFLELGKSLKKNGLHIALDTSGHCCNKKADELIDLCDLVILDIKFTNETDYKNHTGGSLKTVIEFLKQLEKSDKSVWIRQVIVPDLNDSEENILKLAEIVRAYKNIEKVELLPFKKLCLEKYKSLGIEFPLEETPEMPKERLIELETFLEENLK